MANFTARPQLVVDFTYFTPESKKEVLTIRENDILKDVVFTQNGVTHTKTGKVTAIMTTTIKSTTNYGECACILKSNFDSHVIVDGFVLDSSNVYGADTTMIFVNELESIGEVVEGKKEVDLANLPEGGLAAVVAALEPGQELKLGAGVVEEAIELPVGCVLRGANAGVGASKGYRAQSGELEGETVINAPVKAKGGNVVIDGVTLSGNAVLTMDGNADLVLSNTRIDGLAPVVEEGKKGYAVLGDTDWKSENEVTLVAMNCYFGSNPAIYNFFEMNCKLQSGSVIKNCYFAKDAGTNNLINIYDAANGAHINIIGNTFEMSPNAVRVGTKGNAECTINMTNNTYLETVEGLYAGFMLIQPFGKMTESMGNVVINIDGLVNKSGNPQTWYAYGMTDLTPAQYPKVFVDGVQQDVATHIVA